MAAFLWFRHVPDDPGPARSSAEKFNHEETRKNEQAADPSQGHGPSARPGEAAAKTPALPAPKVAVAVVSREMDIKVNPYAGALREPGKSRREWDAAYLQSFGQAKAGDPVRFELTNGAMAEGTVKILQFNDGKVSYVSGELTAPEAGKFFFLTPPAGGKAGTAVGVVEFPASKTAYRVEPTGNDGTPELWQRRLDEVICLDMQEADPAMVASANKTAAEGLAVNDPEATGKKENLVPVRPDKVQDFIPSYNANIISLQSYPGSPAVLLLDFAGGYTSSWGGVTYSRAPVDNDNIRDIWKRIAEDYMPFNINVTTDAKVFQAAPAASRQRCCFGPNPVTSVGVAYFGSWNWGNDTVCWAGYYAGKAGAEVGAHEPGHTLGLAHQGQEIPNGSGGTDHNEYFAGQGSGVTGWCPIMGAAYYQPVTTFAKGEYQYANQPQDELLTISTVNNNVAYRTDDTGSTLATSRYLDVNADNTVTAEGVIERTGDTDAFQFTTTGGSVTLAAKPVAENDWADLGIQATIANSSDTVIATNNVQSLTSASITTTLAAGTYTFKVTGVGKNSALTDGFSNYASLGYYYITGSVPGARQPTRLSVAEHAANSTVVGSIPANNPNSSPLVYTIASGNTGTTFSVSNTGVVSIANNALLDYYTLAANTGIYGARFELFVDITNTNNAAYNEANRRVLIEVQKLFAPVPIGLTAEVDTAARLKLSWSGSLEAVSYNVKRATVHNGPYTTIATTSSANYSDTGLTHGVTYYYVVSAVNANGESGNSAEASGRAQALAGFGFETPYVANNAYNPAGGFWTFSGSAGNGSGILANASAFGNPNAPEGSQVAFIQSYGTITQTLSGFVPGTTYVVSYAAAQRPAGSQNGGESWNVTLDGTAIQTNSPGGTSYAAYSTTFVASAATHTLAFVGTDLATGDNTVFIDNVQVSIVAPTITNSSFEAPSIGTGTGAYQYNPAGGSWTFTAASGNNGSGLLGNGSAFTNPNAPMGTQAAFVQGTGTLSQAFSGFTTGKTYTVTYSAAQRPGNSQSWDVKIGSTVIQSSSGGGNAYTSYSATFVASASSQTLTFAGTNLVTGDNTVFIDNVSIISPPQATAPSLVLTSPANNASYLTSATVNLAATLTANSNLINSVQFYADSVTLLSTSTSSPYSYSWTGGSPGWHTVFARVQFNNGSYADSATVRIALLSSNQNLSFETPSTGNYQYGPTGGSWSFSGSGGSGSGIVANGSGFTNPAAPAGTQAAFLQSYGKISQTLGGFVAGNVYTITYSAAQRTSVQNGGESWDVTIDDKAIKSNLPGTGSYTSYTATFTATAAVHTLAFAGTDLAGNDNTVFIDNVSIAATLSPPTGLAATGGNAQASLSWTAASGATSYNVKRATVSGGPYTTVANVATTSYVNTGLTNSTAYYYVVSALNAGGESGNSGQTSVTPLVTIPNPSFESPALAAGAFQYNPTGGSWTFSGASPNGSGLVANGSGFSNPNAPAGTQAAFIQGSGALSQSLTGLNIGTTYAVTFAAAQRSGANQHGGETWNVKIDSTLIGSYNPGPAATSYVDYTATFTASAATQSLSFIGTNLVTGDNTVFVDNVRIAVSTATLPSPWQKQDIGVTGAASSASYASGVFTVNGAGTNVAGTADSVSSLYQLSSADCSVTLRVATLQNTNANAKAGVMIRESLNANASEAGVWVTPGSGIVFTTRSSTGGATTTTASTGKAAPYWVRIVRTGNAFAAYYSVDGSTWTQLGTATTISMSTSAYIGTGVESGDANQLSTATIDNVTAVP